MRNTTIPPFNLAHTSGPLRWARFADADGAPAAGAGDPAGDDSKGAAQSDPTQGADTTGKAADDPADPAAGDDDLPDDPEKLKALLKKARADAGKSRVNAKTKAAEDAQAAMVQQIGKALGLIKDEKDKPTADQLTEQLTAQQEAAKAAQTQLAVYRASGKLADPDMLLDSSSFLASLKDVDITDTKAVQGAVKAFVTDHPKFAPTQVAGASTVEHPGGTGEGETTPQQFRAMGIAERTALKQSNPTLYARLAGN